MYELASRPEQTLHVAIVAARCIGGDVQNGAVPGLLSSTDAVTQEQTLGSWADLAPAGFYCNDVQS